MATLLRAGLIGNHIGASRFGDALAILAKDGGFELEYSHIDTGKSGRIDFAATARRCKQMHWTGLAVTYPWKPVAARFVGRALSIELQEIGAINLVTFLPHIRGANTDFTGFLGAWHSRMGTAKPGRVAMAGAGGVARAIGAALVRLGATDLAIWDDHPLRAKALAKALGPVARVAPMDDAIENVDGLVNATPLGMENSPGSAFPLPLPHAPAWAFDAVYTPTNTPFIAAAREAGAEILSGFDLFCHMALGSFERLSGSTPDPKIALPKLHTLAPD